MAADDEDGVFVREQGGESVFPVFFGDLFIDVAGVMVFAGRFVGIKAVDFFEMRGGGVQAVAVDADMAVIADLYSFSAEGDKAFDVVGIGDEDGHAAIDTEEPVDVVGTKDDDLPAFRASEVVGELIDEESVPAVNTELEHRLAFADVLAGMDF